MAKELFVPRRFNTKSRAIIAHANKIIAEYQAEGFTLTLRQLYYQFVARDLLANKMSEYKRLGSIINDARLAGLIDWDMIEDRTRNVLSFQTWDNPAATIKNATDSYLQDVWADQEYRPEVWIEKNALIGVIEPVCSRYRVPHFACIGYTSQSEQYRAGKRFADVYNAGQTPIVFHLGDHDPSGLDMTRDNTSRLEMFAGVEVEVVRLALNMDQVRKYNPPPNPAKEKDKRFRHYARLYGRKSWELDALDPKVIDALIKRNLDRIIDKDLWDAALEREETSRAILAATMYYTAGI